MIVDFTAGKWINEPKKCEVSAGAVSVTTEPETDLWQRSYYGFRNDNAPALLVESDENFTFTTKVRFVYQSQFDQCGLVIYIDSENWFKASIEYENEVYSRLGSVVTTHGYSDWATSDITPVSEIWYRLNRRGPDFLIESSIDGMNFNQMRIFHLHCLGETTEEMGREHSPLPTRKSVRFGIYACSPTKSSFTAKFTSMILESGRWLPHGV